MSSPDFVLYSESGSTIGAHWTSFLFNEFILMQFMDAADPSVNRQGTTTHVSLRIKNAKGFISDRKD